MVERTEKVEFTLSINTRAYQEKIESKLWNEVWEETNIEHDETLMVVLKKKQNSCEGGQSRKNEKFTEDTRNLMQRKRKIKNKRTMNTAELRRLNKNVNKGC